MQVGFIPGYDGYGNVVIVQLRAGYSTLYAHLSQPLAPSASWFGPES